MNIIHEHDTGKGFKIRRGGAYRGSTGEVRYVHSIHKPGSGYGVTWDSVSYEDYYKQGKGAVFYSERDDRPHGYMTMKAFKDWAVRDVTPEHLK
ncbi:hypothetical protein [Paraburkholderia sp. C35]|uniref:hypothetical protein n=1 Tax=Paraburkholderia sp. C35 TaxID=2126993 RepID=UPI000D6974E9|nr:hypothetical protein [Paraburkholderia sp. C35]